ncbi:MAG: sulfatase-like hydrolase/transferase [Planctomycetota bacterium]|nr:sulfatase-like hydrolase/transferase [Planctomycetota bacterium]
MNRREFCASLAAGGAALAMPRWLLGAEDGRTPEKPNIIFILSDDVGLGNISCCGGDKFKTPQIDALAAGGLRFEYSYATPLCGPSRCEILTGRYPFRTGLISNHSAGAIAPDREVMMPTVLKKAGYVTAQAGKWGQMPLGPGQWGFDESLFFPGSGRYWREQTAFYTHNGERKDLPEDKYLPDIMHDFVVDFIGRNREKPFYLYYSMSHVHGPIVRTPDSKPGAGQEHLYADNNAYMDKLVGKLVAELDRLKLREKTLVIFVGDNGTAGNAEKATVGGRPLSGHKATMLEGGSRVPLIANWPGTAPAGKVLKDLTDFSDFFVTLADLAGAKLPDGVTLDGRSFAPQLKGRPGNPREWVYVELDGKRYVRTERWKLTGTGELLDMKESPFKEIAVAADTTDAEAVAVRKHLQEVLVTLVGKARLDEPPPANQGKAARAGKKKAAKA